MKTHPLMPLCNDIFLLESIVWTDPVCHYPRGHKERHGGYFYLAKGPKVQNPAYLVRWSLKDGPLPSSSDKKKRE